MSWTEERVELLRQLWLDGKSASQISAALGAGLTRNAVIGKVHRLGLAGRAKAPAAQPNVTAAPKAQAARRRPNGSAAATTRPTAAPMIASPAIVQGNTALAVNAAAAPEAQPARSEEEVVIPLSRRVTIVDLKESMCRWPLGDPTSPDFRYCGSPSSGTTPYCQHHGALAYQPAQDRRRERERERRPLLR
ncbi:MAG: GcrA family cell cycle regulator [Roseiarcus sp.]